MHKGRICEEIASGTEWNEMNIVYERKEKKVINILFILFYKDYIYWKRGVIRSKSKTVAYLSTHNWSIIFTCHHEVGARDEACFLSARYNH